MNFNEIKAYQKIQKRSADETFTSEPFNQSTLIKVNPEVLAKQITHIDYNFFKAIPREEFRSLKWSSSQKDKITPNINRYIQWSNQLTLWVQNEIQKEEKSSGRFEVIKKFLVILKKLEELKNYSSMMAIFTATQSDSIYRLDLTKQLTQNELKQYENLSEILQPDNNFEKLRDLMNKSAYSCIPFLGIFMKDLTYSAELKNLSQSSMSSSQFSLTKLDYSHTSFGNGIKNFASREERIENIIEEIFKYRLDLNFPVFKTVQDQLCNLPMNVASRKLDIQRNTLDGKPSLSSHGRLNEFENGFSKTGSPTISSMETRRGHQRSGSYNRTHRTISPSLYNNKVQIGCCSDDSSLFSNTKVPNLRDLRQPTTTHMIINHSPDFDRECFYRKQNKDSQKTSFQLNTNCQIRKTNENYNNDEEKIILTTSL